MSNTAYTVGDRTSSVRYAGPYFPEAVLWARDESNRQATKPGELGHLVITTWEDGVPVRDTHVYPENEDGTPARMTGADAKRVIQEATKPMTLGLANFSCLHFGSKTPPSDVAALLITTRGVAYSIKSDGDGWESWGAPLGVAGNDLVTLHCILVIESRGAAISQAVFALKQSGVCERSARSGLRIALTNWRDNSVFPDGDDNIRLWY